MSDNPDLNKAQQAYSVRAFHCDNPRCRRTHVAFFDEKHEAYAHFVMPEGFIETLKRFEYASAVARDDKDA